MILEDVKLVDIEQNYNNSIYFRSRIVKITTDRGSFLTPKKVITRSEHIARSNIPLSKHLPLDTAMDFRLLENSSIHDILNNSKSSEKLLKLTKQFNNITNRAIFRLSIFQPPSNILSSLSKETKIKFANIQAEYFQEKLDNKIITFPFLNLEVSDYKEFINEKYKQQKDNSVIFVLDLQLEKKFLQILLEHLISKEQPLIVILIYKDWQKAIPQYDLVHSYFEKEHTAFFMVQVEREDQISHTSNLHSLTFGGGFDLVSLMQSRGYSSNEKLDLNKVRFFDPASLSINNIENTLLNSNRKIVEEFNLPEDNYNDFFYIKKVLNGYRGALINKKKFETLYALARTHETITSYDIFEKSRRKNNGSSEKQSIKVSFIFSIHLILKFFY
jgi:hypothetical protein